VRPNFYCGQLLTDADLSAMVQWSRDRFALSRFRDGWGVVCGLEVTCSAPQTGGRGGCGCTAATGPKLWIGSGYAVDCCGNDLVVCDPIAVDLSSICRPADDPCADPCAPIVKIDEQKPNRRRERALEIDGLAIPWSEVVVADLALRYGEQPSSGQRPMFQGPCADLDACEPSRIRECPTPVLTVRDVESLTEDSRRDEYERWLIREMREMSRRLDTLLRAKDVDVLIRNLGTWRTYSLCFVLDWLREQDELTKEKLDQLREWLLLDWLMHIVSCDCKTCRTDEGVPLARVILWRKEGRTECCRPLFIFPYAPWRRELARDCRPSAGSRLDLLPWLGRRVDEVVVGLNERSIAMTHPMHLDEHERLERAIFSATPNDRLQIHTVRDWLGETRVVGFGIE
jgi:hypothetical protein